MQTNHVTIVPNWNQLIYNKADANCPHLMDGHKEAVVVIMDLILEESFNAEVI